LYNALKKNWIPGQARNDNTAKYAVLSFRTAAGAMVAVVKIMGRGTGSHSSTLGGNPISCGAAMATLEHLENSLIIPVVINMFRLNRVSNEQRSICVAVEHYYSL
jgi:adenosylmethionine-8-amino-7-oxononanoate aminotransferase